MVDLVWKETSRRNGAVTWRQSESFNGLSKRNGKTNILVKWKYRRKQSGENQNEWKHLKLR